MASLVAELPPRPLRRAEYDQLVASGSFGDERLELLDGTLVAMSPQGSGHVFTVHALYDRLRDALHDRATVRSQSPLALSEIDEPEPDIVVVPHGAYRDHLPDRAILVIEVSDTTRRRDLGPKSLIYARAGVPEYWVVDLQERRIVVHADPRPDGYVTLRTLREGEALSPASFEDVVLTVADLLP